MILAFLTNVSESIFQIEQNGVGIWHPNLLCEYFNTV